MNAADLTRLNHMLVAAQEAILFANGKSLEDLHNDRMLLLSLVKEIEIIGEAAKQMSPEGRAAVAGVPWSLLMAMRNRLTHGYFDWDTEIVWDTVRSDLPNFVRVLETFLSSLP